MRLEDGFATLIAFSLDANVKLYEKSVTPPGWEGGEPVNTSTFRNTTVETMQPQKLMTMTPMSGVMAFDALAINSARAMINKNQIITVTFEDGKALPFWGYLRSFIPNEFKKGDQPTANVVIQPTNQDNSGNEVLATVA